MIFSLSKIASNKTHRSYPSTEVAPHYPMYCAIILAAPSRIEIQVMNVCHYKNTKFDYNASHLAVVKNVGPGLKESIEKQLDAEEAMYRSIRQSEIDHLKTAISMEKTAQVGC